MNTLKLAYIKGSEGKFKLLSPLIYYSKSTNSKFVAPAGFVTDGASIPKVFWSIIGSPFTGKYLHGAVIHDCLYSKKHYNFISRKYADNLFLEIMLNNGTNKMSSPILYLDKICFSLSIKT